MRIYVAKGINVACRTIVGDAFIFKEDTRDLLKLDKVGSFIWDQIDGHRTINEISQICCDFFESHNEEVASGVADFITTLVENGVAVFSRRPFEEVMASAC